MDALKTVFIWPFYTLKYSLKVLIGIGISLFPLLFKIITQGISSIKKNTDIFLFFNSLPFGKEVFTLIIYLYAPYSTNIGIL